MHISQTKPLRGLLYTTPVLMLTLVACGGGGGGSSPLPLATTFTIGGSVTGLTASGLKLRNNGGDDLTVNSASTSYTFATSVASGGSYNVTVLTQPTGQVCSVANASGGSLSANVTNANVTCVTAHTIGVTIKGASAGIGPTLQNNGGDNLFIPAITTGTTIFTFSTSVASGGAYSVTQLTKASAPPQDCAITAGAGTVGATDVNVVVDCTATTPIAKFAYATNSTAKTVQAYTINSGGVVGGLTQVGTGVATGSGPYSVSVDPAGKYAYVVNSLADTISAYSINSGTGALTAVASIATGDVPISITIHPSGKFAYVANQGVGTTSGSTISAYSINPSNGTLAAMDADGATAGTQATIATGTHPYAVTIDPTGKFAYVANYDSSTVSVFTIDQTTGALTAGTPVAAGTDPSSVAIDPTGKCALVTNSTSNNVMSYTIAPSTGALASVSTVVSGSAPRSVAVDPVSGTVAFVANAGSASVSAFSLNPTTCAIASIDTDAVTGGVQATIAAGTTPFSVNVGPSGAYVYVANHSSDTISVYSNSGGALTPLSTPTFATETGPTSVTTTQ